MSDNLDRIFKDYEKGVSAAFDRYAHATKENQDQIFARFQSNISKSIDRAYWQVVVWMVGVSIYSGGWFLLGYLIGRHPGGW